MRNILLSIFSFLLCCSLMAQQGFWSNAGALVSVREKTFVSIQGDAYNADSGFYHNRDTIYVTGDWQHNALNRCFDSINTGWVVLHGNNQYIEGASVTHFHNLVLTNQGVKFGDTDVVVNGTLFLTDREMNMDKNTVFVTNVNTDAVQRTAGFVSSLESGGLLRYTASDSVYLYPVGSTLGIARYRPIELQPAAATANHFKIRFANIDATLEGFDRSKKFHLLCEVIPNWYHRIWHPLGNDSTAIKIFYNPIDDGNWNDMAHWQNVPQWQAMPKDNFVAGQPFSYMQNLSWNDFTYPAFALANSSLPFAEAGNDTAIYNGDITQLGASSGVAYQWNNTSTLSDLTINNPLAYPLVDETYFLTVTNELGCEDYDSVRVTILPRPEEPKIPKEVEDFFIPNAITPNNDGFNDSWYIKGLWRYKEHNARIINRWGDEVFFEAPYENVWQGYWQGKPLPGATYYYILKVKMNGEWKEFNGPLTIVR